MLGKQFHMATVFAASTLLLGLVIEPSQAQPHSSGHTPATIAQASPTGNTTNATGHYQTLYVNPNGGNDRAQGLENQPLKTVTRALEIASPNTVIVLAPGNYTQATGEVFPLRLKSGVTIQGTPGTNHHTAIIEGGGQFESASRAQQNAAIIAADRAGIAQIAISNPDGYGVWVESASPTILETALVGNRQTGLYIVGGSPLIRGSYFSGNEVAGIIVFGSSSAQIQGNLFEGTGDAIRVIDGATPEIVGNRMTNNEAGLVLIGDANPVLQDNRMVGNRHNDVIEVATSSQNIAPSATHLSDRPSARPPASLQPVSPVTVLSERKPLTTQWGEELSDEPLSVETDTVETDTIEADAASNRPVTEPVAEPAAASAPRNRRLTSRQSAGARNNALENSNTGFRLASRAVTDGNPDLSTRRRRRQPTSRNQPATRPTARPDISPDASPEIRPAARLAEPSVNNNRLAVPNSDIPLGSGGDSVIFSAPRIGVGAPPAPSSRAQALGLYYRVFVDAPDPFAQDEIKEVVPDAFRTHFGGRTVMQVGAFETEEQAEERRRLLEDNNLTVRVEYIR